MCGIAGFYDYGRRLNPSLLAPIVRHMTQTIRHRGPDGSGFFIDAEPGIALGHRRLAVVDLTDAGHQPMTSACGRFVLTYNGEIFNGPDIRSELGYRSIHFRGHSDTEVIVEAIAAWGVLKTTKKLIGMFAFALWDKETRTLTLVRDRLGIKPLYVAPITGGVIFGSELKAIYAHPSFKSDIDPLAVRSFLRFGYIGAPNTIDKGAEKQKPGTIVTVSASGQIDTETFWSGPDMDKTTSNAASHFSLSDDGAIENLHTLLKDAIGRRMEADVPLGAFLSGGIDSSLVVALMQKLGDRPVQTFSIGFQEAGFDESPHARAVAHHLGTDHREWIITPTEAQDVVKRLPTLYDEPFADSSQIPTYLVSEFARRHVTVSLSGDGGDELFGGYNRYLLAGSIWDRIGRIPLSMRSGMAALLKRMPVSMLNTLSHRYPALPPQLGSKFLKLSDILKSSNENEFYHGIVSQNDRDWTCGGILGAPSLSHDLHQFSGSFLRKMQLCDLMTYLPDDILTKVDRASMAVGLEARVPLLDHRLVEFAFGLPDHLKVRGGETKWILRQVLYQYVPRSLIDRPKMGFGIPLSNWLCGGLKSWADGYIYDGIYPDYLDMTQVRAAWENHQKGTIKADNAVWCVLMFLAWYHQYKQNPWQFQG